MGEQDTNSVVDLIARGLTDQAVAKARELLQINGASIDAQYQLALALLQNQQAEESLAYFTAVTQQCPDNAQAQCNLGVALLQLGQHQQAIIHLQKALALDGQYAHAAYNLGISYYQQEDYDKANNAFIQACKAQSDNVTYVSALADCCRKLGQWQRAVKFYQQAITLDNSFIDAYLNITPLMLHTGEVDEAENLSRKAIELQPQNELALQRLGDCLRVQENFDEAVDAYADAFEINPDNIDIIIAIAQAWLEQGEINEASAWFERALKLEDSNLNAIAGMALVLKEADDTDAALELLQKHQDSADKHIEFHLALSDLYWDEGDAELALKELEQINTWQPHLPMVLSKMGQILSSSGDVDKAVELYQTMLEDNPDALPALNGLASIQRGKMDPAQVDKLHQRLQAPNLKPGSKASLHNALAQYYDGIKQHADAAEHMKLANTFQWQDKSKRGWHYTPQQNEDSADALIAATNAEHLNLHKGVGHPSTLPVFIVGMPRSGTTLTEQILGRHDQVLGIGERNYLSKAKSYFCGIQSQSFEQLIQAPLSPQSRDLLHETAEIYLEKLQKLIQQSAETGITRVVDKMPDNYQNIAWIKLLFPNAKIIHCRRDVRDVAMSCWQTQFGAIQWACQEEHLIERFRQYQRLMTHWRNVLPEPFFESDYENLVTNQEPCSKALINYLGLEWDAACLQFYNSDRLVRTASITQVRKPIYQSSVAKWKAYEALIPDLIKPLAALNHQ